MAPPSSRHRDKDAEFVTLCKGLCVTDQVCDRAWTLWKTVQDSMEEITVCISVYLCDSRLVMLGVLLKPNKRHGWKVDYSG